MKLVKIENTLFIESEKHNIALGYLVISFRKRDSFSLSAIRNVWKRAKELESTLSDKADYISLVSEAKEKAYVNRKDTERALKSVIHPVVNTGSCSLSEAWDFCFNGKGISKTTGKQLKVISRVEKRRKALVHLINSLQDIA